MLKRTSSEPSSEVSNLVLRSQTLANVIDIYQSIVNVHLHFT